jgi:hypothetical protein
VIDRPPDIRELIDLLGGNVEVARALEIAPAMPSGFVRRNSIPWMYWASLIQLAARKGISLDGHAILETHYGLRIPRAGRHSSRSELDGKPPEALQP